MTGKAVNLDTYRLMTDCTKLTRCIDRNRFLLLIGLGMAINTIDETVAYGAIPFPHGQIAVMEKKLHVLLAHDFRRLNALVTLAARYVQPVGPGHTGQERHQQVSRPTQEHSLLSHTHIDIASRTDICTDMTADTSVIIRIDIAAHG